VTVRDPAKDLYLRRAPRGEKTRPITGRRGVAFLVSQKILRGRNRALQGGDHRESRSPGKLGEQRVASPTTWREGSGWGGRRSRRKAPCGLALGGIDWPDSKKGTERLMGSGPLSEGGYVCKSLIRAASLGSARGANRSGAVACMTGTQPSARARV